MQTTSIACGHNPLKYIDRNGDSIVVVANAKGDARIWDAFKTLERTPGGEKIISSYEKSSDHTVYIGYTDGTGLDIIAWATTRGQLKSYGEVRDNKIDFDATEKFNVFKSFEGKDVSRSENQEISIVGLSKNQMSKLDKYDLAMVIYHEFKAHVDVSGRDGEKEHKNFGGGYVREGLLIRSSEGGIMYDFKSDAWNMVKSLLFLKIEDGKATKQNIADFVEMVRMELVEDSRKKPKKNSKKNNL